MFVSCSTVDLYEKTASIPGHSWKSSFKPSFTFTIKDTISTYEVFLVIRHSDRYNFNNIWLNVGIQSPGSDSARRFMINKQLGSDEKGWLGSGMDDIYEHRVSLNEDLANQEISLRKPGSYTFTLEQIMRDDPLSHVLNAGIRIEKKQ